MNEKSSETQETIALFHFFLRHYKILLITVLASVALSVLITFFIPNEYVSYGSVFPPQSASVEATLDNPILGYDVEADRLMQILQSKEMQNIVISKYKLIDYYKLDTLEPDWKDKLQKKYFRDVTFTRTNSMSVVITARTEKPELSTDIVNTLIDSINPMRDRVLKENFRIAYHTFKKEYEQKTAEVDSLVSRISELRDQSQDPQLNIVSSQMMNINVTGNRNYRNTTELEKMINDYLFEQAMLNEVTKRYYKAKHAYERPLTSVYVIDRATVSYKKVYPSFTMNILIAAFGSFLACWVILYLYDRIREIRKSRA